jgi:hypothetical protein
MRSHVIHSINSQKCVHQERTGKPTLSFGYNNKINDEVHLYEVGDINLYQSFFTLIYSSLDVKGMDCVIQMK